MTVQFLLFVLLYRADGNPDNEPQLVS